METVNIIGGGISGLTLGVILLKKGYHVEIYEKNNNTGGCCSGWYKDNIYIDNCMHWLTGTNRNNKLYKLWEKVGALSLNSDLYEASYFYKSHALNQTLALSSNLEETKQSFLKLSPSDEKEINRLFNTIYYLSESIKNPNFIKKHLYQLKAYQKLILNYKKLSLDKLAKRFTHPLIQKALTDYIPKEYSSLFWIYAYATFVSGNGFIYQSGSLAFQENIKNTFLNLGGIIHLNCNITNVEIKGNIVTSISTFNHHKITGNYFIFTIDPNYLFNNLIPNNYMPKMLKKKYQHLKANDTTSSFQACFTNQERVNIKDTEVIEINPIKVLNKTINRVIIKEYHYLNNTKPTYQIMIFQNQEDYDSWQHLRAISHELYNSTKQQIASIINHELNIKYQTNFELLDVWTPLTYSDYLNLYKGSYMAFSFTPKSSLKKIPSKIPNLDNAYICTVWQMTVGGLPQALLISNHLAKKYF